MHVGGVAALFVPIRAELVIWLLASYFVRMFGVTAGYHRYFSHRSYKLGRAAQFVMAVLAQSSGQHGVLWWASHHRYHHRYSDQPEDLHSPWQSSFWYAHIGWVLSPKSERYDPARITDFSRYPELVWLQKSHWVPVSAYGAIVYLVGGWDVFLWGFCLSTVLLYHGTFTINSLSHVWGSRRFTTTDQSRNNFMLALITLGEGWHNNHHYYMSSCRQGLRWWEIDITYYVLRVLQLVGIVREIRPFRILPAQSG
jgi:stearoyl-CoA desaturase (delta-9 desaturase)